MQPASRTAAGTAWNPATMLVTRISSVYAANGSTQDEVYSDYTNGAAQTLPNDERVGELLVEVMDGATYGSRVVALTSADGLFDGDTADNPLGLGDDDPVLLVADLVERGLTTPDVQRDRTLGLLLIDTYVHFPETG